MLRCFFHSFCATNLNFGTKNNGRMKSSILKTLIFDVFDLQFQIKPNRQNIFKAVFIDLWPCLFTTKLSYTQLFKWGHSRLHTRAVYHQERIMIARVLYIIHCCLRGLKTWWSCLWGQIYIFLRPKFLLGFIISKKQKNSRRQPLMNSS